MDNDNRENISLGCTKPIEEKTPNATEIYEKRNENANKNTYENNSLGNDKHKVIYKNPNKKDVKYNHSHLDITKFQQTKFEKNDSRKYYQSYDKNSTENNPFKVYREKQATVCNNLSNSKLIKKSYIPNSSDPITIEGKIRINSRSFQNAYISLSNGEKDILVIGVAARNGDLDEDLVRVTINSELQWIVFQNKEVQKTGVVVKILEKVHLRIATRFLKKKNSSVFLVPRDNRIPLI
jgi:exoribonuclease R